MGLTWHDVPLYFRKMFIGGLNWETTDQSLRDYFSQFGEVVECTVMRDGATGRSRGFGFLTFKDPKTVNIVMVKEHYLDGKIIDPKRAIPRDEQEKTSKIFVGGVSQETTDHEFREYFAQFGRVVDATLMMDKDTGRPRGFGFVTFESEAGVEACLSADLEIHGKPIEVKKAQPRGNLREEEENNRRAGGPGGGKFGKRGGQGGNGMDDGSQMGGMGGMGGGAGGMTPQVMAQYLQRMQQAFSMMQQQMMMNRNMNPAMMQMMQMQQMQQMQAMMQQAQQGGGRGNGQNPMAAMGQMNPAMMQQMQAMMAQQGGGGGGVPGGMSAGPGSVGGPGSPMGMHGQVGSPIGSSGQGGSKVGYSAYEQQQFEQQKYEQQQGRRGGSRGAPDMQAAYNQGGAFGGGGGGGSMSSQGGQGAPTSWEGMYDDVPQPIMSTGGGYGGGPGRNFKNRGQHNNQHQMSMSPGPSDPMNAPPANAPTGPKNAGRPGANYRGGGRGGNRGFHPYARG
ncbi:putative nuclear polyadenylated RNA-binding protein [Triangularia verruculosa]|uniref:Nuclear polyadenylated RNA-binding protein n=1 Tax=Triangularia verruculosa TaxID=2587418 RepID=A0AAN6XJF4_9PEZI|nr:putative nuclear polyadenylated RNA-binding protein [Triangularia verruculosa]